MTRRGFKPMGITVANPTTDFRGSHASRREFKTISGSKDPPPTPYYGSIYRTFYPTVIADYASLATGTWVADTMTRSTIDEDNPQYTGWYYRKVVQRYAPETIILNPVRWQMDAPAANGGAYDQWFNGRTVVVPTAYGWTYGTRPAVSVNGVLYGGAAIFFPPEPGALALRPMLLPSTSHAEFGSQSLQVQLNSASSTLPFWPHLYQGNTPLGYIYNNLTALKVWGVVYSTQVLITVGYVQQYINGVAYGSPSTTFQPIPGVLADDVYSVDIWYKLEYNGGTGLGGATQEFSVVLHNQRVSNNSRRVQALGIIRTRGLTFSGVNMNRYYSKLTHTYNVTLNGHTGWTLKDGSNGPHKIRETGQWLASIGTAAVAWVVPAAGVSASGWIKSIRIAWDREIPVVIVTCDTRLYTAGVGRMYPDTLLYYKPASGTAYRSSTLLANGPYTITHGPCGVFDQAGTTTFELVELSRLNHAESTWDASTGQKSKRLDGYRTTIFPFVPEVPTSITVTRTTQ